MRPQRRDGWRGTIAATAFLAVVALLGTTGTAWGQRDEPPVTVENIRVGFQDVYKFGAWAPVWVDLKAGRARFSGSLEVVVPDDDGTPTVMQRPVSLEANGFATFVTYVRSGSRSPEMSLRVRDENGRPVTRGIDVLNRNPRLNQLDSGQILLVTVGDPRGVSDIPTLSGFQGGSSSTVGTEMVIARIEKPEQIPGRWYGFDAVEALVLDTSDRDVMDAIIAGRGQGLREWVRNGGHLVVAVATNWQQVRGSMLGEMLPAIPNGTTRLNDLRILESYAGASKPFPADATNVAVLEGADERGGQVVASSSATPLVVRGPYGFGRVTVVGLDVAGKPFADWEDKPLFWAKVIDLQARPGGGPQQNIPGVIRQSNVSDLASLLGRSLEQNFEGVTLVPFGWVAFFVFLYILLIGPGDYLFLRKVVKRMELTWITFPAIVILVSVVAYFAAYAVKGTDLRINKVDVVDVDPAAGVARGTTWATVFSPQNRDYGMSVSPLPLDTPPKDGAEVTATDFSAQARSCRPGCRPW